jgi:hypothetical protein
MKKTYEKPKLAAAARLAQTTAVLGRGISYFVHTCGPEEMWSSEQQECVGDAPG